MIILSLPINDFRPEKMQVIKRGEYFCVKTFSETLNKWITQKEYLSRSAAVQDCLSWYVPTNK